MSEDKSDLSLSLKERFFSNIEEETNMLDDVLNCSSLSEYASIMKKYQKVDLADLFGKNYRTNVSTRNLFYRMKPCAQDIDFI